MNDHISPGESQFLHIHHKKKPLPLIDAAPMPVYMQKLFYMGTACVKDFTSETRNEGKIGQR